MYSLIHTVDVQRRFVAIENFGFVPGDIAFDGVVAEQLGHEAFGEYQVGQDGVIGASKLLILRMDLAHLPLQFDDLLDARQLFVMLSQCHATTSSSPAICWALAPAEYACYRHELKKFRSDKKRPT